MYMRSCNNAHQWAIVICKVCSGCGAIAFNRSLCLRKTFGVELNKLYFKFKYTREIRH